MPVLTLDLDGVDELFGRNPTEVRNRKLWFPLVENLVMLLNTLLGHE